MNDVYDAHENLVLENEKSLVLEPEKNPVLELEQREPETSAGTLQIEQNRRTNQDRRRSARGLIELRGRLKNDRRRSGRRHDQPNQPRWHWLQRLFASTGKTRS